MCRFGPDLVCSSPAGGHWCPAGKIKRLTMPPRTKYELKKRWQRLLGFRRHRLFQTLLLLQAWPLPPKQGDETLSKRVGEVATAAVLAGSRGCV